MGIAVESLKIIAKKINKIPKAQQVFVTDIGGKSLNWNMIFQFNLNDEEPFYLTIKEKIVSVTLGTEIEAETVMTGENKAIIKICNGKGDFTHAISREEITVEKGKVMDLIRLTRAITIVLKSE